ncbi:MAG: hypothetical protein IKA59_01715, partial [Clostridia bacterium]|nr:hypothetical protein [Clostridia bacterium]
MVKLSRAKDEQGNPIFIGEVKHETNKKYYCEVCGGELIPKALNSEKKKPHFAHKPDCDCTDTWLNHNNKGDWHIKWQEKFLKEDREVAIGDENEKHRADVQVFSCVVEFQHSPISYEDF